MAITKMRIQSLVEELPCCGCIGATPQCSCAPTGDWADLDLQLCGIYWIWCEYSLPYWAAFIPDDFRGTGGFPAAQRPPRNPGFSL